MRNVADEAEFTRLAALSSVEFDREKKAATKTLGISIATLKEEVLKRRQSRDRESPAAMGFAVSSPSQAG